MRVQLRLQTDSSDSDDLDKRGSDGLSGAFATELAPPGPQGGFLVAAVV
jgi:hypothetical protein